MTTITYNPETHVLVPREPGLDITEQGWEAVAWKDIRSPSQLYLAWKAMLAAAPQPEPVDVGSVAEHELQDTRCECCGYMTYHREHMGCIRSSTPQPDRTAELEAALKVARDGIDEFLVANDPTEFGCACDLSVGYLCGPCHADMQQEPLKSALAKINEVLK